MFEKERVKHSSLKRDLRKGNKCVPDVVKNWKCEVCERIMLSKAGYVNHAKSHFRQQNQAAYENILPPRPADTTCVLCSKVCKSACGLKRHIVVHKNDIQQTSLKTNFICHVCYKSCKSAAGLKSHLRGHGRNNDDRNCNESKNDGTAII